MIYFELFSSFFLIGLFSIGGGYAAIPFIQNQIVEIHQWMSMEQFAEIVAIAEMTPGPIAINAATFVGIQVIGISGAIVATLGCLLPSTVLVLIMGKLYLKYQKGNVLQTILTYLRPAVIAIIGTSCLSILTLALLPEQGKETLGLSIDPISLFIFFMAFLLIRWKKWSPITIILLSGFLRILIQLLLESVLL